MRITKYVMCCSVVTVRTVATCICAPGAAADADQSSLTGLQDMD